MPENTFATAQDLLKYYDTLESFHSARIRAHMTTQAMWEQATRTSDSGRTVYVNNEPAAATALIQHLVNQGKIKVEATLLPDEGAEVADRVAQKQLVEDVVSCILLQTDDRLHKRRRNTLKKEMTWDMAVLGWYAGIALVLDNAKADPWFVDNWSPTDTFPEMDGGTALVHKSMMTAREIEKVFGKNRPGGKLPGYKFKAPEDARTSSRYEVLDYWDDETNMAVALVDAEPQTLKKQTAHGLGHNPAWCNPVNAVPARYTATGHKGESLESPDAETNRWVAFVGQTPMYLYLNAYRNVSEFANQVADVLEQWADVKVVAVTQDGKYRDIDLNKRDGSPVANLKDGERLDILAPSAFPAPLKDWLMFLLGEIQKASFPAVAYGQVGATEATGALQILQQSSGYIVGPIADEVQRCYHQFINSVFCQLEAGGRGKQYGRALPMLVQDKKGKQAYQHITLADVPKGVKVSVQLKGAGFGPDKLGLLAATNQVANSPNPVVDDVELLENWLEVDDVPEILQRKIVQKLTTNPNVIEALGPITTALHMHQAYAKQAEAGNEVAQIMAEMTLAVAKAGVLKLQELVAPTAPQAPVDPNQVAAQMMGGGGQPGLEGEAQVQGVAAPGAPPAGVPQPPTGPDAARGSEMAAAAQAPQY